ncbi:hypothetical protein SAMN05421748_12164 [Paractinoplanes atraurantiacus]|uniref:WD40 repeat n=1 Tax=Paractinoplanes atraurantiacus TaxID=1036182 RepID=A0A285JLE4_9ACTN|nr:hypothetical protein SAMN05421748_12164 [Actinoplanes atraurantiacus]
MTSSWLWWRVRLWDPETSAPAGPSLAGPVSAARLRSVRWQGREMLLTGSEDEGVVALWDLDQPVDRAPGHEERIIRISRAEPADVIVSIDDAAVMVARDCADGSVLSRVAVPGFERPHFVQAWSGGAGLAAAFGAGNDHHPDPCLHRVDLPSGELCRPEPDLGVSRIRRALRTRVNGQAVLVTLAGHKRPRVWRADDLEILGEVATEVEFASGFVSATTSDGRPVLAVTTRSDGMLICPLDDLTAPPLVVPAVGDDVAIAAVGSRVVVRRRDGAAPRAWDTSGNLLAAGVRRPSPVTHAAVRSWPQVYVAHADDTVSLVDLEAGRDVGPPLLLPGYEEGRCRGIPWHRPSKMKGRSTALLRAAAQLAMVRVWARAHTASRRHRTQSLSDQSMTVTGGRQPWVKAASRTPSA